jgi:signal transduction histidine kinase/ActR/RegA family two-component response regulator
MDKEAHREFRLLTGLASALQTLLASGDFDTAIQASLGILSDASGADRVYIFDNLPDDSGDPVAIRQRYEWAAAGSTPEIDNPDLKYIPYDPVFTAWKTAFLAHEFIADRLADRPLSERDFLAPQGILAIAVVPIFVRDRSWGFVGFDNCQTDRSWTVGELGVLEAFAAGLGKAFENELTRRELLEANERLATQAAELKRGRRIALSLAEDAKRSQEQAAAANGAKSTFLAVMSHEMRTPLNGIIGFVDLLLADDLAEDHRDSLRTVAASAHTLLDLINDLLDLARIESGAIEIEPVTGPLRECLAPDTATLSKLAEKKGLILHFDVDPGVPDLLRLDFGRYRQVLMNVVGNAIKFTATGSIRASIRATEATDGQVTLDCVVRDTGTGIAAESLEQIFNPFGQAHRSIQRRFGGTGLGLAICRDLCRLMGGQIDVHSQLGVGSTFRFTVHAEIAHSTAHPKSTERATDFPRLSATHPGRILVVDDVAINRKLINSFLKRLGYQAELATDGSEAVALAAATPFDVILMDVFMPIVDGCEATRQIRASEIGTAPTRIIGISADAMAENRTRCAAAGMDAFLTKPIHLPDLLEVLRSSLEPRPAPV